MGSLRHLQELTRRVEGDPLTRLRGVLALLCELLDMEAASILVPVPGERAVHVGARSDGSALTARELDESLAQPWPSHLEGHDVLLVADVRSRPDLRALTGAAGPAVGSYAGVTVRDRGVPVGVLSARAARPHPTLNPRDGEVLLSIAGVVMPLVRALLTPVRVPRPRQAPDLSTLADAVAAAGDVEQLSRPLLDALHDLTGLASAYLTVIHDEQDLQEIRFARNTRDGFALPEGLRVPWGDTLCKRALDEGRPCTTDVPAMWGDSDAAAALGIQVYVSVPVALSDGRVWGTLCAADSQQAARIDEHLPTMRLFAKLIAAQVEREAAVVVERERAAQARAEADSDPVTRCATRRVVGPWLTDNLAAARSDEAVLAVYLDVDRFKDINDVFGHAAGDAVLAEVGRRLHSLAQPGDLVARLGGDEFLVAARLPRPVAHAVADRYREARAIAVPWGEHVLAVTLSIGTAIATEHDAAQLIAAADRDMYMVKRTSSAAAHARRSVASCSPSADG